MKYFKMKNVEINYRQKNGRNYFLIDTFNVHDF